MEGDRRLHLAVPVLGSFHSRWNWGGVSSQPLQAGQEDGPSAAQNWSRVAVPQAPYLNYMHNGPYAKQGAFQASRGCKFGDFCLLPLALSDQHRSGVAGGRAWRCFCGPQHIEVAEEN